MRGSRLGRLGLLVAVTLVLILGALPAPSAGAHPANETADAMNARLAGATVQRVRPSDLYPKHATTPGFVASNVTQANIQQTICPS